MSTRTVLVLSDDPYLAFLLERHPEGLQVTVGDDQLRVASILASRADLVFCEEDDPRRSALDEALGARLVTIATSGTRPRRQRSVLVRPLSAEDVQRVVEDVPSPRSRLVDDPIGALDLAYPWAVAGSGALGVLVALLRGDHGAAWLAGVVIVGYGIARARSAPRGAWIVDVALAVGATAVFGGMRGAFGLLPVVVAGGVGLRVRALPALLAGAVLGVAAAVGTVLADPVAALDATLATQIVLTTTLTAAVAALGASYGRSMEDPDPDRLGQALRELRTLTRSEPDALEPATVARDGLRQLCRAAGTDRGLLLLFEEDGELRVAANTEAQPAVGDAAPWPCSEPASRRAITVVPSDAVDPLFGALTSAEACTVVPLRRRRALRGVVIVAGTVPRGQRGELSRAASHLATAIGNARLFARLRSEAADEQRRRLAGDLHDSTAQVLAHVRLELELLARSGATADDLERLARVTARAQQELRAVIKGLRASVDDEGLVAALRGYVADLQGQGGPSLIFQGRTGGRFDPTVSEEVFRIAQEAISNAVRHANATVIEVTLEQTGAELTLLVHDDGDGYRQDAASAGLGLHQMRERAGRLGARLTLESDPTGTRVGLAVPLGTTLQPPTQEIVRA